MSRTFTQEATASGMCARCRDDAALPNSAWCRDCAADEQAVTHVAHVIDLTSTCHYGHNWCRPERPCHDCVEDSLGGEAA